jgi:hypothetical protein
MLLDGSKAVVMTYIWWSASYGAFVKFIHCFIVLRILIAHTISRCLSYSNKAAIFLWCNVFLSLQVYHILSGFRYWCGSLKMAVEMTTVCRKLNFMSRPYTTLSSEYIHSAVLLKWVWAMFCTGLLHSFVSADWMWRKIMLEMCLFLAYPKRPDCL